LKIKECLWLDKFVDKIIRKHNVSLEEVEQVLSKDPLIQRLEGVMLKVRIYSLALEGQMQDAI
jgi:hypothetical protein